MKHLKFLLIILVGITIITFQNCDRVKFSATGSENVKEVPCEAGDAGSAICAGKTVYFIGGVAQVFGDSSNADDGSGEIVLNHPFNGKNARVKVLINDNGVIEVHPAAGYYPWACIDHAQAIDVLLTHKNTDGSPGGLSGNCFSPIRWYTDDGQQGFAKDIFNVAATIQKSSTSEVYRRALPNNGIYVTNMVLAPPDRFNSDGSAKDLIWVRDPTPIVDFMSIFTSLYDGVFPYPADATHLKVYEYKADPNNGSSWTDLLIENTAQQLGQAAAHGYTP